MSFCEEDKLDDFERVGVVECECVCVDVCVCVCVCEDGDRFKTELGKCCRMTSACNSPFVNAHYTHTHTYTDIHTHTYTQTTTQTCNETHEN